MYTIIDYIKFYKDTSLEEVKWNELDNLICTILVYLPIKSFKDKKSIKELLDYSKDNKKNEGLMAPKSKEILKLISDSKRYKNLFVFNFVNMKDNKVQFGACTFRINTNTIISYKGTEASMIGWLENFRLAYLYPTYTQKIALDYLKDSIKLNDTNITIVGHSKGGNLAMYSAMESPKEIFERIERVYNFDGPGFRKEEYNTDKYKNLKKKLVNIIPTGSVVGTILYNDNYSVILSNELAFNEHYPTSWEIFGQYFIEGKLSTISSNFHKKTTEGLDKLDKEKLKLTVETIFKSFEKEYSSNLKFTFKDFKNFYKNMKNVDPEIKEYMDNILEAFMR